MPAPAHRPQSLLATPHALLGAGLVVVGEALIVAHARPISDFYFPVAWLGYILVLDAAALRHSGSSLLLHARPAFLALFPLSSVFWWVFELFNQAVHNWVYVGGQAYSELAFIAIASLDFSFVVLALWTSARFLNGLLPGRPAGHARRAPVPPAVLPLMMAAGIVSIALPVLLPRYFFGLIWGALFFLLDPVNERLGRPSMVAAVAARQWRYPLCFALGALMCGFFWEAWNFWAMPKWEYTIPYVNSWRIFEMPLLGWAGYLPFGLELFAMTNFVLPLLGLGTLDLETPRAAGPIATSAREPRGAPATPSDRRTAC